MDFYYFVFVHYILITIIFFSRNAYISVNIALLWKHQIRGEEKATWHRDIEQEKRIWDRPGEYGHKQTP